MDTTSTSSSSDEEELSTSDCDVDETSCDAEEDADDDNYDDCEDDDDDEDENGEKHETAQICGATLQLPQHLCENGAIFREFFSLRTFNTLSEINKQHLKNFLPSFPENDEQEKNKTLQKLFNRETFRFCSPLAQFHEKLRAGHFRPDIARMRRLLKQERRKEYKYQQKVYWRRTLQELMTSRRRLIDAACDLPPGSEVRAGRDDCAADGASPRAFRAKRRYFQELAQIKSQVRDEPLDWSEDENYPEGPPVRLSKKLRRHLNGLQNSGNFQNVPNSEKTVISTLASKPGALDLEYSVTATYNPYQLNEDSYRALLLAHKKRKHGFDGADPALVTKGVCVRDVAQRTQLTPNKKPKSMAAEPPVKPKKKKADVKPISNSEAEISDSDEYVEPVSPPKVKSPRCNKKAAAPKPEPVVSGAKEQRVIASLTDLDGIDMMSLPVDLEDSNIDILDDVDTAPEQLIETSIKHELLMQETHANFLSLMRDVICSTVEHRMSLTELEDRLKSWQTNPISPLNTWYSHVDNWLGLLPSAVAFLTGDMTESPDDYVPYLEFKPNLHLYQWIGAGRDSDNRLNALCQFWLEHRDDSATAPPGTLVAVKKSPSAAAAAAAAVAQQEETPVAKPSTPPPPRHPTNWIVRKADAQEVAQFREQERQRYANPHKSFTYKMNGYESIVGPVKGMYNQTSGLSKARGHSMLNADRPNFVTILTLVRDAVARLPNGEGTRADICELLKSSQYISHCAPENVLQSVVSGALDRLHTEYDPSVKYDTKKKIWIYLHRNRTEADFERIHQQFQGISKQFKKNSRKNKPKTPKTPLKANENVVDAGGAVDFKTPPVARALNQTPGSPKAPGASLLVTHSPKGCSKPEDVENVKMPSIAPTEQDIEKAIQTLTPIRVGSPVNCAKVAAAKPQKSLVKIINSAQGKSLITPPSNHQTVFIKQLDGKGKNILAQPQIAQQLLHTIAAQQKMKQQPMIVTTQQQSDGAAKIAGAQLQQTMAQKQQTVAQKQQTVPQQQQQILQTIKQKVQTQQSVLTLQQALNKQTMHQKAPAQQSKGTSLLGQQRIITQGSIVSPGKAVTAPAQPLVAKVLTNAAGQVISVESLLAHQKQHGTLPQGTTLRVSGAKAGQTNLIQLTGSTAQSQIQQYAVVSSQPTTKTLTTSAVKQKLVAPQTQLSGANKLMVNAKFVANNKVLAQQKIVAQQPLKLNATAIAKHAITAPTTTTKLTAPSVRMVNAAGLNLASFAGKPILLASKGQNLQTIQGGNVILQTQTSNSIVLPGNARVLTQTGVAPMSAPPPPPQPVMSAAGAAQLSQLKVQSLNSGGQQIVLSAQNHLGKVVNATAAQSAQSAQTGGGNAGGGGGGAGGQQTVVLGGALKMAGTNNRVVLASQGSGGQIVTQQILLPSNFQGGAINIKTLQGLKVIPLAQTTQQTKGRPQVFARIMNPQNARITAQLANPQNTPDSANPNNLSNNLE